MLKEGGWSGQVEIETWCRGGFAWLLRPALWVRIPKPFVVVSWFNCNWFRTAPFSFQGAVRNFPHHASPSQANPSPLTRLIHYFQLRGNHFHFIQIMGPEVFKCLHQFWPLSGNIKALGWIMQQIENQRIFMFHHRISTIG